MSDFDRLRQLFPHVESTVIECILIASENRLDVTLDHLLRMSIDDNNERSSMNPLYEDDPPPYPGLKQVHVASSLPRRAQSSAERSCQNERFDRETKMRTDDRRTSPTIIDTQLNQYEKILRKTRIHSPILDNLIRRIDKGEKFHISMVAEEPMVNRNDYSYGQDPLYFYRRDNQ